ncbi:MAG: hypothetical protein QOK29_3364 [Rhodospirillaceae bacterium]|nr:hypothetical protein [Rhodospirillaceae bacterium]
MKTVVSHYGVHWANGNIAYIEQEKSGTNALGLPEKSPFLVQLAKRDRRCNHLIALAAPKPDPGHMEFISKLISEDKLARVMLPVPKTGVGGYYIEDPACRLKLPLVLLSKLSSPIASVVRPFASLNLSQIADELQMTNVQPLVLTGVNAGDAEALKSIAEFLPSKPRTLVLTGDPGIAVPPAFDVISTGIEKYDLADLAGLPWETLGAVIVRRYMRRESLC